MDKSSREPFRLIPGAKTKTNKTIHERRHFSWTSSEREKEAIKNKRKTICDIYKYKCKINDLVFIADLGLRRDCLRRVSINL